MGWWMCTAPPSLRHVSAHCLVGPLSCALATGRAPGRQVACIDVQDSDSAGLVVTWEVPKLPLPYGDDPGESSAFRLGLIVVVLDPGQETSPCLGGRGLRPPPARPGDGRGRQIGAARSASFRAPFKFRFGLVPVTVAAPLLVLRAGGLSAGVSEAAPPRRHPRGHAPSAMTATHPSPRAKGGSSWP
jgi:hypothetical protein